ncbi:MAG: hypothetical protein D6788_11680 [Planctomycetota bacterium]|nr:MAG: hypothetical protein D6788_11680 [Planctomycetota bacterium]
MTEIPPDIPSSAAQAGFQAREVAKEREARRAARTDAAQRQIRSVDETGETVETTDDDVAVFTNAEGTGSQGRAFEETGESATEEPVSEESPGITQDEDGRFHVDLEA